MAERLSRLKVPYVSVIGNHDMLANGREVYRQVYGAENFSFAYGTSKFVCLNTNSNERGYDGSIPDMAWLRRELSGLEEYRNVFVVGHMAPFHEGFDPNVEPNYASLLARNSKVRLSMHAHQHYYSLTHPYSDGVEYLVVGGMSKRNYALVAVEGEHYHIEEHYY